MAEALYMNDSYLREFDAAVTQVNNKYIVLDKTAFFPNGGGIPFDTGKLFCNGQEYKVVFTGKFSGEISHEVNKEGLNIGDKVHGILDWDRRYKLMRYHTAAHIVSGIFSKDGAMITGNQMELDSGRIDFDFEKFDRELLSSYFQKINELIAQDLPIRIYSLPREEALKIPELFKLVIGFPHDVKEIRVVEIVGFDRQADGGCHVRSLREVGTIEFVRADNKGKSNRRVYFRLAA